MMVWRSAQLGLVGILAAALQGCATSPPASCHLTEVADMPITFIDEHPTITIKIAGHDEVMMVDTGAFASLITEKTANALGTREIFTDDQLRGTGGLANIAASHPGDVQIGGILVKDTQFLVVKSIIPHSEKLTGIDGLIGQDILKFYDIGLDFPHDKLHFYTRNTCPTAFPFGGYFAPSPSQWTDDQRLLVPISIDQHDFEMLLDTGAQSTTIDQNALDRAGIRGVPVGGAYKMSGIGQGTETATPERFDSVTIGAEEVDNAVLGVNSASNDEHDGIIGESYLRTHQVYIANDSQTVYFGTYMKPQSPPP